jgi:N-acetylmuramic acid 6-phosphate (MurNAc-6-P) etherase
MNPSPNAHRFAPERALELGRQTLSIEAAAVEALQERLNGDFARAVELILNSHGRLIVSGMGKSGHIARKIAATMASTGTPAYFVHPAEASHGDLGMITRDDVLLALSNSGESGELLSILPALKRQGAKIIAMTGVPARRWPAKPTSTSTPASNRKPARTTWPPPPAPRPRWPWATPWPLPCSTPAASARKISPARTPAARSAAACSPMSAT